MNGIFPMTDVSRVLFRPASEGMVKRDDALYLVIAVFRFRQFGLQKFLLGGEHFQIVGSPVLHQQLGIPYGGFQIQNPLAVYTQPLAGRLPEDKCIVHLVAGIEQALPELQQCLLLLCAGYFQPGNVLAFMEKGLHQRTDRIEKPRSRIWIWSPHYWSIRWCQKA